MSKRAGFNGPLLFGAPPGILRLRVEGLMRCVELRMAGLVRRIKPGMESAMLRPPLLVEIPVHGLLLEVGGGVLGLLG